MKKRADGRYCKQIVVGYKPDGSRKMRTVYGKTIKEVEKKEREYQENIDVGIKITDDVSIGEWAIEWVKTYKQNVSYNTQQMYWNAIQNHIKPQLGSILVSEIKPIQIQRFLNRIISENKHRTAEICKLTIKQFMKQAQIEGFICKDVMVGIQPINAKSDEKRVLSHDELHEIHNTPLTDKQRLFLYIMLYTGLRRGEALALTTDDIDLDKEILTVNKSLLFKGNNSSLKEPKSKASFRKIPIPHSLLPFLKDYIKSSNNKKIFTMKNGEYMTHSSFVKFWNSIIRALKNNMGENVQIDFTPHTFRHTYATNLYYAGVDVKTAQYFLGHSSLEMTLNVYTHLDKEQSVSEVEKLNNYLKI